MRPINTDRFDFILDQLGQCVPEGVIIARTVDKFQCRRREAKRSLFLVRREIAAGTSVDTQQRRLQVIRSLELICSGALSRDPPMYRSALDALKQIADLLGLNAPQKLAITEGIDLSNSDGLLTLERIRAQLAQLRAPAKAKAAETEPASEPNAPPEKN